MTKKYKVTIDRDKCIACGTCVSLMPEVFDMDDADGLVRAENSKAEKGEKTKAANVRCKEAEN